MASRWHHFKTSPPKESGPHIVAKIESLMDRSCPLIFWHNIPTNQQWYITYTRNIPAMAYICFQMEYLVLLCMESDLMASSATNWKQGSVGMRQFVQLRSKHCLVSVYFSNWTPVGSRCILYRAPLSSPVLAQRSGEFMRIENKLFFQLILNLALDPYLPLLLPSPAASIYFVLIAKYISSNCQMFLFK